MNVETFLSRNAPALLMAGSALAWYVASFFAGEALAGDRPAPRARAVGHWIPIVVIAAFAAWMRHADIAVGVLFATSVASVSLVMGVVAITKESASTRPGGFPVVETERGSGARGTAFAQASSTSFDRRMWGFLLPTALLALLAGFRGELLPIHAAVLLVEGFVILLIYRDSEGVTPADMPRRIALRALELLLAILLSALTAWAAIRATRDVSDKIGIASSLPVTAWMVAPALVLPMIGSGMHAARQWDYGSVITTSVGVAILNLCVALPLVIGIWHWQPVAPRFSDELGIQRDSVATTAPSTQSAEPTTESAQAPLRFPISVWRIDTVILILLGLMLLPMSFGRWNPGRIDGAILICVYLAYMWLTALIGRG